MKTEKEHKVEEIVVSYNPKDLGEAFRKEGVLRCVSTAKKSTKIRAQATKISMGF